MCLSGRDFIVFCNDTVPKELGKGQQEAVKVEEYTKNTCLEHSTGEQVN